MRTGAIGEALLPPRRPGEGTLFDASHHRPTGICSNTSLSLPLCRHQKSRLKKKAVKRRKKRGFYFPGALKVYEQNLLTDWVIGNDIEE